MISTKESKEAPTKSPVEPPIETVWIIKMLANIELIKYLEFFILPTRSNLPKTTFRMYRSVGKFANESSTHECGSSSESRMLSIESCDTHMSTSLQLGIQSQTIPLRFFRSLHGAIIVERSSRCWLRQTKPLISQCLLTCGTKNDEPRIKKKEKTDVRVGNNVRIASTQFDLFIFTALHRTGWEAVKLVDLNIIFFRKATVPLLNAYVMHLELVFNIFHCQLAAVWKIWYSVHCFGN